MNRFPIPTFRDLAAAIVALSVFAATSALIMLGKPIPQEWWPAIAAVTAWLFAKAAP